MKDRAAQVPTPGGEPAAFVAAFAADRAALEAWRRSAAVALQQEQHYLGKAELWRARRFECEARAAAILTRYPDLAHEQEDSHDQA
jgi:hypothetical protein